MARRKQKNRKRLVERVGMKKERSGEKATGRSDGGWKAALKFFQERNCFPILDSHWATFCGGASQMKRGGEGGGRVKVTRWNNVASRCCNPFLFQEFAQKLLEIALHPPPVITGEDGRGAWLRNYNDCVRVQVAAGQFGYGNSGADCLFIGCPRVSTLLDDIHRFLLINLPANDFSIFSIFRYLFPFSFFSFNGILLYGTRSFTKFDRSY